MSPYCAFRGRLKLKSNLKFGNFQFGVSVGVKGHLDANSGLNTKMEIGGC